MKRCFSLRSYLLVLMGLASIAQAQTPVNLGNVQVSQIGHIFLTNSPPYPNWTADYFIDQSQQSGGGSLLQPVTVDWNTNHEFTITVSAPPGDMFLIQPSIVRSGKFSGFLWWANGGVGFSPLGTVTVSFANLQGVHPDFSQSFSVLSDSHSVFGFGIIDSAPFTKEIAFTSMVITGTAVPQSAAAGALVFTPDTNSSLTFISATSGSGDPGPSVSIVPFNYRVQAPFEIIPSLDFARDEKGDFAVRFVGTLQSSAEPGGPFTDVLGHPLGAFVVPKESQGPRQFFRVRYTY